MFAIKIYQNYIFHFRKNKFVVYYNYLEKQMPTLSMFYGIIIHMQSEKGGKHHEPHIHCVYGEQEAVYSLDGNLIEGSLPANKSKLVEAWISLHEDELRANWQLLSDGENFYKIPPLS